MTSTDRTREATGVARKHEQDTPSHLVVYRGQADGSVERRLWRLDDSRGADALADQLDREGA